MSTSNNLGTKRKAPTEETGDAYINFSIKGQDGVQLFYKVNQNATLYRVFREYSAQLKKEYETLQFLYDGTCIKGKRHTPKSLNMVNGDEIIAARHQTGGGVAAP